MLKVADSECGRFVLCGRNHEIGYVETINSSVFKFGYMLLVLLSRATVESEPLNAQV